MRTHTDDYKNSLIGIRKIKNKFSYEEDNILKELNEENLVFVKPILNSELFKTTMKQLDFETKVKFKEGTKVHFESGLEVNGDYEYINYGDYFIFSVEYQAPSQTYYYTCYDNMLKTMIPYEPLDITYPIWVRSYINEIATACGLEFAYSTDRFGNYNKEIIEDYFKEGNFTYRDILDYLCQVIGGWLYIDENNKLSIKYPTETNEIFNADYLNYINVSFEKKYGPINSIVFSRANELDNLIYNDETSIETNGLCQVKFSDNPFLSGENRQQYMSEGIFGIIDKIIGLQFYINDLETKGIPYLEIGDLYNFKLSDDVIEALKSGLVKSGLRKAQNTQEKENYKCLMINSEDEYRGGLKQLIYTPEPEDNVGQYMTTTPTNNSLKNAEILVNKNAGELILKANSDGKVVQARLDADADDGSLFEVKADNIKLEGYTTINNGFSVDLNGNVTLTGGEIKSSNYVINTSGTKINLTDGSIDTKNFKVSNTGTITATGGTIGGWNLQEKKLYSGSSTNYVALDSGTNNVNYTIWAGNETPANAPFSVTRAGSIKASSGQIAGYTINGAMLVGNNVGLSGLTGQGWAFWAGSNTPGDAPFRVGHNGTLYATSGSFTGSVNTGSTITGSSISGGSISISQNNNTYYFNMGVTTSHPNCSGLNVGSGGININGLGFNSNGSKFTFASQIDVPVLYASTYLTTNRIEANGSVNIHSGGNDGSYANNGGIYMATGQVSGTPSHITLNADPGHGLVYAEGYGTNRGRVATDSSGPSSRCLKENIIDYKNEEYDEALQLLNEIKIYNYKYKYKIHDKENQYGFIIDDLLDNQLADKFLYFKDETAGIMKNGRFDYSANNENNPDNLQIIDFKRYDEETLIKYLVVVCKALQYKIDKLERE